MTAIFIKSLLAVYKKQKTLSRQILYCRTYLFADFSRPEQIKIGQRKTQMIIIGLYVHGKEKKNYWKTIVSSEIHKDTDLIQKPS